MLALNEENTMRNLTEANLTEAVVARLDKTADPPQADKTGSSGMFKPSCARSS